MANEMVTKEKVEIALGQNREIISGQARMIDNLKGKMERVHQEGLVIAANVLATAETVGAAFGMGFLRGYYGDKAVIFGLPIDAASGLVLHGIAYGLGFAGGKTAKFVAANLHNLANGSLACWASASGANLGFKKAADAQQQQQQPTQPNPPAQPLSAGTSWAFGASSPPQLPAAQPPWSPWAAMPQQQGNPWGAMPQNAWSAIPQQQGNPMTQEELAAAMAWQQAAA